MAHTTIKRIISTEKKGALLITTIEDEEGNVATGVGEFAPHTPIITFMDDRYNKVKFMLDSKYEARTNSSPREA
jgi:hypothetical protein